MPRSKTYSSRLPAVTCGRGTMGSNDPRTTGAASEARAQPRRYWPIWQLTLSRLKEFVRQPAAIFWVYGFPIVMLIALGTAFRDNPAEQITVDLVELGIAGDRSA